MKAMAEPALKVVMENEIRFFPEKLKNTYSHWMENVKDWCISRQLWWGQRIPAYYLPNRDYVIAKSLEEALEIAKEKYPELNLSLSDLKQDEDVLDTWFSSWLWPLSLFDGIRNPDNQELNYYYPTAVLVTAPEIIFFWVARMIMAGMEWKEKIPFKDVYFTGIVRDKLRRKMSKSLGNSPDPLDLIAKYGADGVRFGMLLSSPAGNDLLFDENMCEQGRNFSNKIWNAFRLIKGWEINSNGTQPEHTRMAIHWMNQRINQVCIQIEDDFKKYRLSEAQMTLYKLIWDDFCSYLLEVVKPPYQQPIDKKSYDEIIDIFEKLMLYLHPFMPFITEELWQALKERNENESIMIVQLPKVNESFDEEFLNKFSNAQKIVEDIRRFRAQKNIPQKNSIKLQVLASEQNADDEMNSVISKLCNLSNIEYIREKPTQSTSFIQQNIEYFIPFAEDVNVEEELAKLQAELNYAEKFLTSVSQKLSNEKFVNGAPENVVALERKKQSDAEEKINILKNQIETLSKTTL